MPELGAERQTLPVACALAGIFAYWLLFYAAEMPSLAAWADGAISRGKLAFLILTDFHQVMAGWFGDPGEAALLDRLPVVLIASAILAWAAGLGWLMLVACGAQRGLSRLESFVFSTAVGLNAVSTYVLAVGLLGLLGSRLMFVVPAVVTLAVAFWLLWSGRTATSKEKPRRSTDRQVADDESDGDSHRCDWLSRRWLWLAAPFALAIMLGGMLPPVEFDVREYHLQVPKEFFQQGHVGFLPHNVYGNMPMGTEMLSLLAMVLTGDWWLGALAGKTVIAAFAPLTALGLFAAGGRFISPTAGVVAAVVYISTPWIANVSSLGLVDGAVACYLLLAVYALLLQKKGVRPLFRPEGPATDDAEKGRVPFFLLAGYLSGGAVSCKYPAILFVVVPLTVWILFDNWRGSKKVSGTFSAEHPPGPAHKRFLTPFFAAGVFLLVVLVGCGLWLGKNWALTGNPTYPLLDAVFDSPQWSPQQDEQWNAVHRSDDFSAGALVADMAQVGVRSEWLSPLLIPLAALAFSVPGSKRLSLVLLIYFGFIIACWWLLTHRIDRFWIPALPLLALLAGAGACWSRDVVWRRALVGLLVVGSILNLVLITSVAGGYTAYFVALDRLKHNPLRIDPWHARFNANPPDGLLLTVGDAAVFDLEVPISYSTCFDESLFEQLVRDRTPREARAGLVDAGVSHVYVNWAEIARYRSPGNYGFSDFVQPAVLDQLEDAGVLEPLPAIEGHRGRAYRVLPADPE